MQMKCEVNRVNLPPPLDFFSYFIHVFFCFFCSTDLVLFFSTIFMLEQITQFSKLAEVPEVFLPKVWPWIGSVWWAVASRRPASKARPAALYW